MGTKQSDMNKALLHTMSLKLLNRIRLIRSRKLVTLETALLCKEIFGEPDQEQKREVIKRVSKYDQTIENLQDRYARLTKQIITKTKEHGSKQKSI